MGKNASQNQKLAPCFKHEPLTPSERKSLKRVTNEMWEKAAKAVEGREPRFGYTPLAERMKGAA